MFSNQKIDFKILLELPDKEFFNFCAAFNSKNTLEYKDKNINQLCKNENLWKERLFKYYGQLNPEYNQTWKNFYLKLVYYMNKYGYEKNNYSFIVASKRGHLEVVKFLSASPYVDPSAYNNEAIVLASKEGHLEVVKFLTKLPSIDPSAQNNAAIKWASKEGHLEVVQYLSNLPGVSLY